MGEDRRPTIVGVMGSGTTVADPDLIHGIGRMIAEEGHWLLTGGGQAVMAAVARGYASLEDRQGYSLGILPAAPDFQTGAPNHRPKPGYPNDAIDVAVVTHLNGSDGPDGALSRNHINILTAHAILAFPGGAGTEAEVRLALRYQKPVMALLGPEDRIGTWRRDDLPEGVPHPGPDRPTIAAARDWLARQFGTP